MNVLTVFTKYTKEGPSSNFRTFIYKSEFEKEFKTKYFAFWTKKYYTKYVNNKKKFCALIFINYVFCLIRRIIQIFFSTKNSDIILVQKSLIPGFPRYYLPNYIRNKKIILDIDDAVYLNKRDDSNYLASIAHTIIVGNEFLKTHYEKINRHIFVVPTIDYTPKYIARISYNFDKKIIGWIGSKSSIKNLDLIVKPLNELIKRHPDIVFVFICDQSYDYDIKIKNAKFVKWNQETYIHDMSFFTIGIMPLVLNDFNLGKCGFKLIQYLNLNLPIIASPIGINKDLTQRFGYGPECDEEWIESFENLLFNKEKYDFYYKKISTEFYNEFGFDYISKRIINIIDKR